MFLHWDSLRVFDTTRGRQGLRRREAPSEEAMASKEGQGDLGRARRIEEGNIYEHMICIDYMDMFAEYLG